MGGSRRGLRFMLMINTAPSTPAEERASSATFEELPGGRPARGGGAGGIHVRDQIM